MAENHGTYDLVFRKMQPNLSSEFRQTEAQERRLQSATRICGHKQRRELMTDRRTCPRRANQSLGEFRDAACEGSAAAAAANQPVIVGSVTFQSSSTQDSGFISHHDHT
jgi:hypothetical protein